MQRGEPETLHGDLCDEDNASSRSDEDDGAADSLRDALTLGGHEVAEACDGIARIQGEAVHQDQPLLGRRTISPDV